MKTTSADVIQSSELYPQQILPVNTSVAEGYNLPTPPHSPLQITDLSVMTGHRHYSMEPVQSMPTDLSMHDHLENFSIHDVHDVFGDKDILLQDLPEILNNSFVNADYPSFDPERPSRNRRYIPSPTSCPSPVYTLVNQSENHYQTHYIPTPRSVGSVGYDSDQDGSLSDDTCVGQIQHRQQEDYYMTPFHNGFVTSPPRTHNYQRKTDPISISELTEHIGTNGCRSRKVSKKKTNDQSGKRKASRGKGRREAMKGNHLWEFIRDLLKNKTTCPRIIRWENRQEGVFRFVNSEAVAGLWGTKKNNPNMNYEKLSRAMRYYYKREILERVDGRRLVYKFGCNADGWKEAAAETQDE
ncbi:hypothetical protein BSL78_09806 [Apostichopus japonicus]|uniref:ETS domain-containing protein n=1 Tax=Stichopus japonicus TaxID=307972 RepID=A0A2G8KZA5_STIJA|nr:hypothetical protein BSL78_09806 [Apostichopus japonicus]